MKNNAGRSPWLLRIVDGRSAMSGALIVGALVIAVAWIDYQTGWELSFSIFYMVPVALGSWRGGSRAAVLLAVLCAIAWFTADELAGHEYSRAWIPYWNATVRMGMFLALGLTLAALGDVLDRAQRLARVDELTGLANLRAFNEQLGHHLDLATRHHDPITLATVDLDHFKAVNDTRGHAAGDQALATVAKVLGGTVRKVDLTARLGGDEFVVLLPRTDIDGSFHALEKVRLAIESSMRAQEWPITASIGAATCRGRISPGDLLTASDRMLYRAKAEGGNRVVVERLEPPAEGSPGRRVEQRTGAEDGGSRR